MKIRRWGLSLLVLSLATAATGACGGSDPDSVFGDAGAAGSSSGDAGPGASSSSGLFGNDGGASSSSGGSGATPGVITVTLRDFRHWEAGQEGRNPDFENVPTNPPPGKGSPYYGPWVESTEGYVAIDDSQDPEVATPAEPDYRVSIVKEDLGEDGKPVYNDAASFEGQQGRTATTHGKAAFDQWYRDVPGTNMTVELPLVLEDLGNGVFSYDSRKVGVPLSDSDPRKQFFPLDGLGFGNTPSSVPGSFVADQTIDHNYHFTMELHTVFTYAGDETFRFTGDDDIFVFINKKRVIDIGGIHGVAQKEVRLADVAERIGITPGNEYRFDLFQAERHVTGSNVRLDTTIRLRPVVVN